MADSLTPSELTEQMFATVGRAITQWSFVENELCHLLSVCIGSALPKVIGDNNYVEYRWTGMWLFYSVENWRTKLQMVDAAIDAYVVNTKAGDALMKEWTRLSEKANKLARKRNKLAHWFVRPAQKTGTGTANEPIAPAILCPPYGSPSYYKETGLNSAGATLTAVQVQHLERAFCILAEKISALTLKVAHNEELRDRSVRQALDRLRSDGRLDPRLVALLEQTLSSRA